MPRNYYISGEWNVICDSCGKKIKAHEAKQRWDGLIVCPKDFEMRQPQDFVKARQDKITVPFTRPRPTDDFIYTQGFFDAVAASDSDGLLDYIDPLSGYFLEDYMQDYTAFTILMSWNPTITDTVTVVDALSVNYNIQPFADSVALSEDFYARKTVSRTLNDTTTVADSGGSIFNADYTDATYFLGNNYVGTSYTF